MACGECSCVKTTATATTTTKAAESTEGERSTDKCLRAANNGGAGSGVRGVLTFLYARTFLPVKVGKVYSRRAQCCTTTTTIALNGKTSRVSERRLYSWRVGHTAQNQPVYAATPW